MAECPVVVKSHPAGIDDGANRSGRAAHRVERVFDSGKTDAPTQPWRDVDLAVGDRTQRQIQILLFFARREMNSQALGLRIGNVDFLRLEAEAADHDTCAEADRADDLVEQALLADTFIDERRAAVAEAVERAVG